VSVPLMTLWCFVSLLNTLSMAAMEHISNRVGPMSEVFEHVTDIVVINMQSRYVSFTNALTRSGYELTGTESALLFKATSEVCLLHSSDMADTMGAYSFATPTLVTLMATELSVLTRYKEVTNLSSHTDTAYDVVRAAEDASLGNIVKDVVGYLPVGWTETTGNIHLHLGKLKQGDLHVNM